MGTIQGYIIPKEQKEAERKKIIYGPHCFYCGSPYVSTVQEDFSNVVYVTCCICEKKFKCEMTTGF